MAEPGRRVRLLDPGPHTSVRPGAEGTVATVEFQLNGQKFLALNGGPLYQFNAAVSIVVECADQAEIDYYWDRLTDGGQEVACGWLVDKYGLSWQVVPTRFLDMVTGGDQVLFACDLFR